ncbi:hypothetical protein A3197_17110 [Candidatus Thiodiazotropha endoloripes]|nr:hypothetical protein A3197_17110 [Candidatus Thiodiazotropha endoloripes]
MGYPVVKQQSKRIEKDPVCGMTVSQPSRYRFSYEGIEYHFCSEVCRTRFSDDPLIYLHGDDKGADHQCHEPHGHDHTHLHEKKDRDPGGSAIGGSDYTCPMHPGIIQDHPGSCPKCGMALESRTVTVEEKNEELIDMSRRFRISALLALPVFLLAMVVDLTPHWLPDGLSMTRVQWIEFSLSTPVVLWGGWPFFVRGWQSVVNRNLNMFTLIGLGVATAWSYSVIALLFPNIFPLNMRHESGTVPGYFEAAAVITALVLLGQVIELQAPSRTNTAIKLLLGLAPKTARNVREDGTEEDISSESVLCLYLQFTGYSDSGRLVVPGFWLVTVTHHCGSSHEF